MTTEAAAAAQPLCALHRDLPSAGTCARCGRFACKQCFRPDTGLCAECALRTADPLRVGGPFSIGGTLASGWRLFVAARWMALGVTVGMALAGGAVTSLTVRQAIAHPTSIAWSRTFPALISGGKTLVLGTWLYGALLARMTAASRGEALSGFEAIGRSSLAWPRMLWAQLVAGVISLLGVALCVLPAFYAAAALWLVMPAAYLEPGDPAVKTSSALTRGRRWEVLALLMMSRGVQGAILGARVLEARMVFQTHLPIEQRALIVTAFSFGTELFRCALESFEVALVLVAYLKLRQATTVRE